MHKPSLRRVLPVSAALGALAALASAGPAGAFQAHRPFLDRFNPNDIVTVASAVPTSGPATGDQNPYGVAVVRHSVGKLVRGDVLVSNFNNGQNQQGTGSSIVEISPGGHQRVFAVVPAPKGDQAVGLTTALTILQNGYVVVGNLPAPNGNPAAVEPGALTILNPDGRVAESIAGGAIDGPWDMTAVQSGDRAVLFVTNVLNGITPADAANNTPVDQGTVVRLVLHFERHGAPELVSERVIADGFVEHTDPNALVVGPTGVGLGGDGVLYVADSNGNRIAAVPDALFRMHVLHGGGDTVSEGAALSDPLGLTIAPNGDVLSVNGGDGNIVETSPRGAQVAVDTLVPNGAGDLFGLALAPHANGVYFVNDSGSGPASNSLQLLQR
jgi:hypothetical protein